MPEANLDPRLLAKYINHPIEFIDDLIFRFYPISPRPKLNRYQKELCQAIVENDWVSVRSGRGRGKTTGVALLIPWYLATRPMARVVATAPKIDLLHDILWAEINKWLQYSPLKQLLLWTKEKVECDIAPNNWYAVARTAKSKENLSGYHESYQLMIGEEASGIADDILETIEQTQLNNENKKEIKTILISNPTKVTGYFYKTHRLADWEKFWKRLHFKPTDHEVEHDAGAQRTIKLHGKDHDLTRVNVYGEFPAGNPQAILSYEEVSDAMNRTAPAEGMIEIGVDVARFGDDNTVMFFRYGYKFFPCRVFKKQDTAQTEDDIITLVRELRRDFKYDKVIRIKIDDSTFGGGVVDHLQRNKLDGIEVVPCLFGSMGNDFYANGASIMASEMKVLISKIELPRDDILLEEMCGRNWEKSLDNRGRQRIESKDDFKKRIHRSPDRFDACLLCGSSSQEREKILPKLVSMRGEVFKDPEKYPVRFDLRQRGRVELFGTVWHEKDISLNCLATTWDKELGILTIYYEGAVRMMGPDPIVDSLTNVCEMYNSQYRTDYKPRQFMWYGNRAMFGLNDAAIGFENIKDGPYMLWMIKHSISILPNFFFDLGGAILQLNKMLDEGRIIIHKDCSELKRQLETWTLENDRPDTDNRGLCMALCNIISMLVQSKRAKKEPHPLEPYGVRITATGEIITKHGKTEFLNNAEKIFASGHQAKMLALLPRVIEK